MSNDNKHKEDPHLNVYKSYTGGPKGYGDPNDMSIRHVERHVHVTQIVKDRAHVEKCHDVIQSNRYTF